MEKTGTDLLADVRYGILKKEKSREFFAAFLFLALLALLDPIAIKLGIISSGSLFDFDVVWHGNHNSSDIQ